jgi:hypothetical protein
MSKHLERFIDFYIADTNYPGFKHRSFNLRIGRGIDTSKYMQESTRLNQQAVEEYRKENIDWESSPFWASGPQTFIPRVSIQPRHLDICLHIRYGKQLVSVRPEITWNRKRVTNYEAMFKKK